MDHTRHPERITLGAPVKAKSILAGNPTFNQVLFQEAMEAISHLSPENLCAHSQGLANSPDPMERLPIAAGIRALSLSPFLFYAEPHGAVGSMLFYLVSLCEGVIMPRLQILVELAAQEGYKGPPGKNGKYPELRNARLSFGPAIRFLATHAAPALAAGAPTMLSYLQRFEEEQVSAFRNAVAHFQFRIETSNMDATKDPAYATVSMPELVLNTFERTCKLLHVGRQMQLPMVPNPNASGVRYEERLGRPITKSSRFRSLQDTKTLVADAEQLGFALLFAHVEQVVAAQEAGKIKSGLHFCGEGTFIVPATKTTAICPACGLNIVL